MNKVSYWIALNEVKGIGISALKTIYASLESTGLSIQDICELSKEELEAEFSFSENVNKAIVESQSIIPEIEEVYHDILAAGIEPLLFFESRYPTKIARDTSLTVPPILYTFGFKGLLEETSVGLLASSETSTKAEPICYHAARLLSEHKTVIAGGLNKGSGTLIASGTLENRGSFLGVIPCGLLQFSMSEDLQHLFDTEKDVIISPFFPRTPVSMHNAIYRNEIICALSEALYIIEMPEHDEVLSATLKHASRNNLPLFTTEYAEFAKEALGNKDILKKFGGKPIRGKKSGNIVVPNIDPLLAITKFGV